METKDLRRYLYTIVWSLLVFLSIVPDLDFAGFMENNGATTESIKSFLYPISVALFLFVIDTWYTFEENGLTLANVSLLYIGAFVFFIVLSIVLDKLVLKWIMFSIAWLILILLKLSAIINAKPIDS